MKQKNIYYLFVFLVLVNLSVHGNPLFEAFEKRDLQRIAQLIRSAKDAKNYVNACDQSGNTPLHMAVLIFGGEVEENANTIGNNGANDIFSFLLRYGANPEALNGSGESPIGLAYSLGYADLGDRLNEIAEFNELALGIPQTFMQVTALLERNSYPSFK